MQQQLIDHLFRHHYGKMVSILTRIFGLAHLETIEDAVQDTFIKASLKWRTSIPKNPEAWLTTASKHRVLDIFRQIKSSKTRESLVSSSAEAMRMTEFFLDTEIEDSQLRMIFTACHPKLQQVDQIAFALKTVAGFSSKEIATALLTKEDTVKKRLSRARKHIQEKNIAFKIPMGNALPKRIESVLNVLYLIFNEGFHSNKQDILVRKELCGESIRLCKIILKNETIRTPSSYALFALMCFHAARMDSKIGLNNEVIDLKNQDRSLWYFPMIELGNSCMYKAMQTEHLTNYHFEAAIVCEHLKAASFNDTNWSSILNWYRQYVALYPSPMLYLNMVMVYLQLERYTDAKQLLNDLNVDDFNQRQYLYHGVWSEYYAVTGDSVNAIEALDKALVGVINKIEKQYLLKKRLELTSSRN